MTEIEDEQLENEDEYDYESAPSQMLLRSCFALFASVAAYFVLGWGTHAAVIFLAFPDEARAMSNASEVVESDEDADDQESNESDSASSGDSNEPSSSDSDTTNDQSDSGSTDDETGSEPARVTPSALFWGVGILIYYVAAFVSGSLIGRLAPMATMGHGVFLAAILFLSSLQAKEMQVFDRPAWALAAYVFGVPMCVMIGTWFMLPRELSQDSIYDESSEAETDPE